MAACPDAPKKSMATLTRILTFSEHEKIQYWGLTNGCTTGFIFNEEKDVTLFKLSEPGRIHWSKATERITFDQLNWKKFRKWCKDLEYYIVQDVFSPEAFKRKWRSKSSPQDTYHMRLTNFAKNEVSLHCYNMIFGDDWLEVNKHSGCVRYDRTSWEELRCCFKQIDDLFLQLERNKETSEIKLRLTDLF
ncbi:Actin cytoskeleton-regulatory complex protein PAN1 [Clarias magur]|uniref:Actin cytoskeleton-regulatory complex protein PAN1 n=1 Tax=Clarias magur TaxID=1594786 RepID=A0A8J4TA02_CLAMG|nr:Actin cytoskeleton-regulatory complex protein PAN1 [Clarias magur]